MEIQTRDIRRRIASIICLCIFALSLFPVQTAYAAAQLTITPLTWNVVGLDSNNVNVGPNNFPVGARVCNTGDATANNVSSAFQWEAVDPTPAQNYIDLRSGSNSSYFGYTLAPAQCTDFYYEIQVTRDSNAYNDTRRYYITATADTLGTVSTPTPREIYVEHLISQNRNAVTDVQLDGVSIPAGGTMNLMVGNTYNIELFGKTATQGYEQLESFINFPNTIFQVNSVTSTFTANAGTDSLASTKPYADGCIWINDPNSPNYRSCVSTGKYGGTVTVNYNVTIIGGAGSNQSLNTLIYDFSGSSYHYNSDFSTGLRYAAISGPAAVTITKSFSPKAISPGGTSVLTFKLSNPTTETVNDANFTDTLQGGLKVAATPNISYSGCGAGAFSPAPVANATSLAFSNGTISPNSICTINISVTADTAADYSNTTGNLFINGTIDTGNTGTDTLKVASTSACQAGQILATWTFPTGSSTTVPAYTTKAGNVTTALASTTATNPALETNTAYGNPQPSWSGQGFGSNNGYFQFQVDTSKYTGVSISFDHIQTNASWNTAAVTLSESADGSTFTPATSTNSTVLSGSPGNTSFNASAGTTYFRISATGAQNNNSRFAIDNVTFTGCLVAAPAPTIAKSFSPDPIIKGNNTVLTFIITNTAVGNVAQTGISFTDVLPDGLSVANATTSACNGTNNLVTNAAARSITLTNGSLAAGGNCTFNVTVTGSVEGSYQNITDFLSSNQSGPSINYATDTLTVIAPPELEKSFSPSSILINDTSTLSFTITNLNQGTSLTNISFTDTLPAGVTATNGSFNYCNGTLNITGGNLLSFSGGSVNANSTCSFNLTVTGTATGTKNNITSTISSTEGGSGNTASATLVVSNPQSLIGLSKQVSTDGTNWLKYVGVTPTQDIYYRFTITNDGETVLNNINVSDSYLNMGTCAPALPASLAVGASASCMVGPISITSAPSPDPYVNTASVSTSNYTPGTEGTSAARYGTKSLSIDKTANKSTYSAVNETVNYSYLVTNDGGYPLLGPVTVTDDKVTVTCPAVSTVGDGDNYLDPGEALTCSATYTVLAGDMTGGSVTNTAHASADGVNSPDDSVTLTTAPNLSLTKSNGSTTVAAGGTTTYTLTVSNTGNTASSGTITVMDVLPTGITVTDGALTLGGTNSADWVCSAASNVITCTSTAAITAVNGTSVFSFTSNVSSSASGSLTNRAQVGGGGDPLTSTPTTTSVGNCTGSNTPTKGCAIDTDTASAPNLSLTKSDGTTTVTAGGTTTYTLTVSNTGNVATSGTITVLDVLPNGMSITDGAVTLGGANSADWTCSSLSDVITCTSTAAIPATNGTSVFSFTVGIDAGATGALVNRVQVGGGGDPLTSTPTTTSVGNCTAADTPTKGCAVDNNSANAPVLGLAKSNGVTTVSAGGTTTYTLTVSNTGDTATSGTITVVDVLPNGMSIPDGAVTLGGTNSANWTCAAASNVITCTSMAAIAATNGTSVFSFTVNVSASATGTLTNRAQVGGGGDTLTSTPTSTSAGNCTGSNIPTNGCAVDSDTAQAVNLSLAKDDGTTTLTAGGTTIYTLTVTNTGNIASSGTITVVDVLPSGLTITDGAVTLGGADSVNWACNALNNEITCTSNAVIAATNGTSVFSFTVNVSTGASGTLTNRAQVGGGGDPTNANAPTGTTATQCSGANTPNEGCAVDSDTVNAPDLTLAKTNNATSVSLGGTTTYELTVTNAGNIASSGTITVVDVLPSGMNISDGAVTLGGANSANWTCTSSSNVITCTSATSIAGSNATSVFSFTVNVNASATGTLINKAQVGGGGDPTNPNAPTSTTASQCTSANTPNEGCAIDSDSVNGVFDPPSVTKTFNDSGLPELEYRLVWINSGNNFVIDMQVTDPIPTGTTYVTNSIQCDPRGSSSTAGTVQPPLSVTAVPTPGCGYDAANNQIQWQGNIGPDAGNTTEATANNEVVITFRVTVDSSTNQVFNEAFGRVDIDADNNFVEENILGTSFLTSNQVVWNRVAPTTTDPGTDKEDLPDTLPLTGFAPEHITLLPTQPMEMQYKATDVWLEIPSLGISLPIVGVPLAAGNWDLTWLGDQAGWLEGTAFPSWSGNSVLTGHTILSDGKPGPFASLEKLKWGDIIIVHAYGYSYVFKVQENKVIKPNDTSVLKHQEKAWLTLITCKDYNATSGQYTERIAVQAIMISSYPDEVKITSQHVR